MNGLPFAKKSLGQHWLTDQASLQAMCLAAGIAPNDTVLEIGPGIGTLTELLVQRVASVVAVELDSELALKLPERVSSPNLQVVQKNILDLDLNTLPRGYKVVANIPFYLTSNLIRKLSESDNQPIQVALLVQKELAKRVAAKAGDTSLLSISTQFYWEVSLGRVVPAILFEPVPKVDSQILVLKFRPKPLFPSVDHKMFFQIVKAGFAGRRKKLLNSLSSGLRLNKATVSQLMVAAKLDPSLRAQNLALEDWYRLYKTVLK
ncbi:MAG: 16S rRNA (adenine(1518)-N(6)/adenine(1519)-N(6))-dimethyltransferase RsmA [Candidatus Saccharimonadales bacterium]